MPQSYCNAEIKQNKAPSLQSQKPGTDNLAFAGRSIHFWVDL